MAAAYVALGITYFISHPSLWCQILCPTILTIICSLATLILLFIFALPLQADGFTDLGVPSWLSWIIAVILVLIEGFLVMFIFSEIFLSYYTDKIYEQVLEDKGLGFLLENSEHHTSCLHSCCNGLKLDVVLRLFLMIITLPLNAVPIFGNALWLYLNGVLYAWDRHTTYFDLIGLKHADQRQYVKHNSVKYGIFGMAALALEIIPALGFIFRFTNVIGSALWAAQMEKDGFQVNGVNRGNNIPTGRNPAANLPYHSA